MSIGDPSPFIPWNDATGYFPAFAYREPQVGDRITVDRYGFVHIDPPFPVDDVPNRLYGATINSEGDVI